jgi:hypothetical protein
MITYVAIRQENRHFGPCAQVLLDGHFFGFVFPFATADVERITDMIGLSFTSRDDESLTVDLWPSQLAPILAMLTDSIPPF